MAAKHLIINKHQLHIPLNYYQFLNIPQAFRLILTNGFCCRYQDDQNIKMCRESQSVLSKWFAFTFLLRLQKILYPNNRNVSDYVARNGMQLLSLRNPGTGTCSKYIFHKKSNEFFELLKFNEPFRAWFIGEIIANDGAIYLSPPIDPLFLLLHFVQLQASEKFVPLEHVLVDETYDMTSIADAVSVDQLMMVSSLV